MLARLSGSVRRVPWLALALLGCGNDATSSEPRGTVFEVVQAPSAVGLPGYPLYDSIVIRVVDAKGHTRAGEVIGWVARTSGAVVSPSQTVTDADGRAAVTWTLGSSEGPEVLEARTLDDSLVTLVSEARYFDASKVSANYTGGCALRGGDLWCWSTSGGASVTRRRSVSRVSVGGVEAVDLRPFRVTQGESFIDLRINDRMICGIRASGAVGCLPGAWPGDSFPAVQPVTAPALRGLAGAPTTNRSICGLAVSDSTVWCWNESRIASKVPNAPALLDLGGVAGSAGSPGGCGRQVDSTAWCWGSNIAAPQASGDTLRFVELSVNGGEGCGRRPTREVWCWAFGGAAPVAVKVADGIGSISVEHGIVLGLRGNRLTRWDRGGEGAWSSDPVPTLATQLFAALQPNLAYCQTAANEAVYCGGEHYFTNNSGYYNDQFFPLQPVDP